MVTIPVQCPHCHSTEVIKARKPTAPNAISVKTTGANGASSSSNIKIGAGCLRSAASEGAWRRVARRA